MPNSAAFARVVFLPTKGTFVFDILELKALSIQTTRLQLSNTKIFILEDIYTNRKQVCHKTIPYLI